MNKNKNQAEPLFCGASIIGECQSSVATDLEGECHRNMSWKFLGKSLVLNHFARNYTKNGRRRGIKEDGGD